MAQIASGCCDSGSGDKFFKFDQAVASAVWNITHGMQKFPSVTVVDSAGTKVRGKVDYVNSNEVILTFNAPFTGMAYLN